MNHERCAYLSWYMLGYVIYDLDDIYDMVIFMESIVRLLQCSGAPNITVAKGVGKIMR
jgi:hypothetical protein